MSIAVAVDRKLPLFESPWKRLFNPAKTAVLPRWAAKLPDVIPRGDGGIFGKLAANPSPPDLVADVIREAANDTGKRLRYRAGQDANRLLDDRKARNDESFMADLKALMSK